MRKAWEAAIPVYNGIILMRIINRPKWWILLLFIPVVNLLMFPVIWIETLRTFGFYKKSDSFLGNTKTSVLYPTRLPLVTNLIVLIAPTFFAVSST